MSCQHKDFGSRSLRQAPWGPAVSRILVTSLAAVDPSRAMLSALQVEDGNLLVDGRRYPLDDYARIIVVGAGKAAVPMAETLITQVGERVTDGLVITKDGHAGRADRIGPVRVLEAGHPLPDMRGVEATRQLLGLVEATTANDLVICLISGGGSALLIAPIDLVTLGEYRAITNALLARGAPIQEINTLRKHLDRVKGGGLAQMAAPAQVISFILSDVVGDPLDIIASGPTVAHPGSLQDAIDVLHKYDLFEFVRPLLFESWQVSSPPVSQAVSAHNLVIANNGLALKAAQSQAKREGYQAQQVLVPFEGEARELGMDFAEKLRKLAYDEIDKPLLRVAGGESTVTLRGKGLGGRNQELALAAVEPLADLENVALLTLATDGGDGPTDAAGALVTGQTLSRAQALGLQPSTYLAANDSYPFFSALGDLITTGPTQTNVNDLVYLFVFGFPHERNPS